jgi:glucose-1-phosphate thymidylyltransferase
MKKWKGIVLAGGAGTRLHPITKAISKQLLPVYDKPLIFYPLSVLMLAEIRDILIITTPQDQHNFWNLLGDGSDYGINLQYAEQTKPNGLAEAILIGEKFIGNGNVCLVLGDNIFYGQGFKDILNKAKTRKQGTTIFGYQVTDPERFGVMEFDSDYKVVSIEEKPAKPRSNFAVTGLYFFDNKVVEFAKNVKPSKRGELEITDVIQQYFEKGELFAEDFGRGFAWLDTGTHKSLMAAGQFVQVIEERQGLKIACLEELGYRNGWITKEKLMKIVVSLGNTPYGNYVKMIAEQYSGKG